jgi:RimJ/RimL family protein N-acetyltransferase
VPDRTIITGALTVSTEVSPQEAGRMLTGPRDPNWATDYPTPGTALTIDRYLRSVVSLGHHRGFAMYTTRPIEGAICGGWAFYGPPDNAGRVEIGYGLAPSGRGRGLMTDAIRAALRWAQSSPAVTEVWAGVDEDNAASIRVLERAGFGRDSDEDGSRRYRCLI